MLVELARQDARLFQLRQQIAALPRRIENLDADRLRVESQLQESDAIYDKVERERRKIEIELQEYRQRRAKSEARQSSLTSTDQYQALLREIEQQEARIDELESALLEAMERSDQAAKRRDADKVRLSAELQRVQARLAQLRNDLEEANSGLAEQRQRRDAAVQQIDPKTRSLYERVLRAKGDAAIALVSGKTCGICNALQPLQVIQELRGQPDRIRTCQVCGRILVWDPEAA